MKKSTVTIIVLMLALALFASACAANSGGIGGEAQNQNNNSSASSTQNQQDQQSVQTAAKLTADEALDIALQQAGVTRDSIRDLENQLDRDNGILVYEIDFESGNTEYSYDINAETGAVVERDRDREN